MRPHGAPLNSERGGATVATMSIEAKNAKKQLKALKAMKGKSEKVLQRLVSDAKTRVPGWVATEVAKVYGIKKSEITQAKVGRVGARGDTVESLEIVYKGRTLTPTHFSMTPKVPRESYTLKAGIFKGKKTVLGKKKKLTKKQRAALAKNFRREGTKTSDHSPIMLMPTGGTYIPFQRKSKNRSDVEAIKTLSLPQMVSSERTQEGINRAISEGLEKRLAQHMKILEK